MDAVLGGAWSAPLTLGHAHGAGGPLQLLLHAQTLDGPSFVSPVGGRTTELLVGGPRFAEILGSHDGSTGDVPPQAVPLTPALVGTTWAAQYLVAGGGFVDLSLGVVGVVTACP
jgi:hypothetical protein